MPNLPGLRVGLALDSATFIRETRRVDASVDRMGRNVAQQSTQMQRSFTAVSSAAKTLAASVGALVTVAGAARLGGLAKDALDAAGNLGEMATQAGITTRQLQGLQVAGVQVGVSSEQMVRALSQFGVRVGEARQGTGELVDTLERYGIATANSAGQVRSSIEILGDLANAVQRAGAEQDRLSIVADAFGSRVGPKLLPILTDGAAGFQRWAEEAEAAGLILDDEFIAAADRASDGIATLQFAVAKGFEIGVVQEFASAVSVTADQIERARQVGEAFGRTIGRAMEAAIDAMSSLQPFFETTVREFNALADLLKRFFNFVGVPFEFAAEAAEDASAAIKPLEVDIRKAFVRTEQLAESTTKVAAATEELTGAQKRLAEAGRVLLRTSALEERFDHQAEAAKRAARALEDERRAQEQKARETERLLARPFENFLQSVQSSTADTFEEIFSGGVKTFSDLFEEAKRLAIRFAAELASLALFNPRAVAGLAGASGNFGSGSLFAGGGVANPAAGGTRTGPGGLLVGGGATSSLGAPAGRGAFGGNALIGGGLGIGAGTLGGSAIGGNQNAALIGSSIGAIGGGVIGSIFPGIGTAIGAFVGGAVGGLAGGLIGGSGGDDKGTSGSASGGLGALSISGSRTGDVAALLRQVDEQLLGILTVREEALVDDALRRSGSINFDFTGLKSDVAEHLVGQRVRPAAQSLGFAQSVDTVEELGAALEVQRAIEDLTGAVSAFERQTEALDEQFADLTSKAARFGISIDGLAEVQTKAAADLRKSQDAQLAALLDPFRALSEELEAFQKELSFQGLNPAGQFAKAQEEFRRIAEEAAGGSTTALQQIDEAGRLFILTADRLGASPLAAQAQQEVAQVTQDGLAAVKQAETEASRDIIVEIDRARRENIDTLREVIESVNRVADEIRRSSSRVTV